VPDLLSTHFRNATKLPFQLRNEFNPSRCYVGSVSYFCYSDYYHYHRHGGGGSGGGGGDDDDVYSFFSSNSTTCPLWTSWSHLPVVAEV
jgi:hypothetical protein